MNRLRNATAGAPQRRGSMNESRDLATLPVGSETKLWTDGPHAHDGRGAVRRGILVSVCAVMALAVAACSPGSSPGTPLGSTSNVTEGANVAAAKAAIAPITGKPSPFPVREPLRERLPAGKKFAYLQCGTPVCGLVAKNFEAAVKAIGGIFTAVNAGATAATSQAAASSVLALKPDVVYLTVDPALYGDSLKQLAAAGIKVITISIVKDVSPFGVTFNFVGEAENQDEGRLLADWVIAKKGANSNVVFYSLPAFEFSKTIQQGFEEEMKKNCSSCNVRTVPIDAATLGTTAPRTVVTDLQAHPDTKVAVFITLQIAQGLPAAISAAGLSGITTVGRGPTPATLKDIKDGGITAALAIDSTLSSWVLVDLAARLLQGDQPTAGEKAGALDEQFLEQQDINFDPSNGWTGYPDYQQRFAALWHTAG